MLKLIESAYGKKFKLYIGISNKREVKIGGYIINIRIKRIKKNNKEIVHVIGKIELTCYLLQ